MYTILSIKQILIGLLVYLLLDYIWLSLLGHKFYKERLNHLPGKNSDDGLWVKRYGALPVRILLVVVLHFFVHIFPSEPLSLINTSAMGALLGILVYGVYNLSNYALLRQRPKSLVIVDTLRGCIACALVAVSMMFL